MVSLIHVSEWGKRNSMAKKKDTDFELTNLPIEAQDPEITQEDFVIKANDEDSHEQKFQTKPTTFFKDSLKRFAKNKSSVVAAGILGVLLLLSIIVPIADRNDTSQPHPEITYLEPKLFNAGTGFWDGTKAFNNIPVDVSGDPEGKNKEENWWPSPQTNENINGFVKSAVSKKKFSDLNYTDSATTYGKDGYIAFGYNKDLEDKVEYVEFETPIFEGTFDINVGNFVNVFDVYDEDKIAAIESEHYIPTDYVLGETALFFNYFSGDDVKSIQLTEYSVTHNIGSSISSKKEARINISSIIKEKTSETSFVSPYISVRLKNSLNHANTCSLIKSIVLATDSNDAVFANSFVAPSFSDATECFLREQQINAKPNPAYWSNTGEKLMHMSKVYFCDFVYDVYEAKLGVKDDISFPYASLERYRRNKWLDLKVITKQDEETGNRYIDETTFKCHILNKDKCPLVEDLTIEDFNIDYDGTISFVHAKVYQYKVFGYDSMPRFLFGTDKSGRDMLKYVFEGLRTSLLLGIITTVVCFIFGLIYGAVSGYFGGTVDLIMERFTDILSGIPWIVVMTLVIIHLGSNFITFAIALCLTGWIGTAATTRTQFYRFRGREYVLASRTLGASDARLIAKHILPNAMGTIITSAVLMVPSVIFSEATISYLGLGLKNLASLGVILSYNQTELSTNSFLLLFPSVIIALVMISFNLFGNGLRDAVNPSLKGEEE